MKKTSSVTTWGFRGILFLGLLLGCTQLHAQLYDESFDTGAELNRYIQAPATPEAAAFNQYGKTEVNLYNGIPNIQVPIYVHKGRELNLPISLTYDAGGIKVEQQATNVGLAWNLNVGGRVSRIVNGMPDDYDTGMGGTTIPYKTIWNNHVSDAVQLYLANSQTFPSEAAVIDYLEFLRDVSENEFDPQPDYFSMNALGMSETFTIDVDTRDPMPLNNPRVLVDCFRSAVSSTVNPPSIPKWEVTGDDGTRYFFEEKEITKSQNDYDISTNSLYGFTKKYVSSWYLTKVISANGKDTYEFEYGPVQTYTKPVTSLITRVQNAVNTPPPNDITFPAPIGNGTTTTTYSTKSLERIKHNGEIIAVFSNGPRDDMDIDRVNEITIYSDYAANEKYMSYAFDYDYFNSGSSGQANLRLKLDAIDIKDKNGVIENSYAFEYELPNSLPSLTSKSQDYYGYYNGKSNSVLYPRNDTYDELNTGGDRSVDFNKAKIGTLTKLTYPTGGYTEFVYEANRSSYVTPSQTTSTTQYVTAGSAVVQGGIVCDALAEGWDCPGSECSGNGCIDTYLQPGGPPNVSHSVFSIETAGPYLMNISLTGVTQNYLGKYVFLIKRGSDPTACDGGTGMGALTLDQIIDTGPLFGGVLPGIDLVYSNATTGDYQIQNQQIVLDEGCYQVTLVNPEEGSTTSFNIGSFVTTNGSTGGGTVQVDKAGLRVRTIKDYTDTGVLATEKKYSYSDGKVISQPLYQYLTTEWYDNAGNVESNEVLYRQTHVSGLDGPHIGYEEVTETFVDYNDSENNDRVKHTFYSDNWGSHFTGVYTYYIQGKQTSNNYGVRNKLGKPNTVTSRGYYDGVGPFQPALADKYKTETKYEDKDYYVNEGLSFLTKETYGDKYPIPTLSPTGDWVIELIQGTRVPSLASVFHGGDGVIRIMPPPGCTNPDICNPQLSRLKVQFVKAFGRVGVKTEETKTEFQSPLQIPGEDPDGIVQTTYYEYYDNPLVQPYNFLLKNTTTVKSEGETLKQELLYPENLSGYSALENANMVAIPVQTKVYQVDGSSNTLLSNRKTLYSGTSTQPSHVQTAKGNSALETRIQLERYENDNVVQAKQADGASVAYIWGYDQRYIVAQVQNATYADIEALSSFGSNFVISESLSTTQENALRGLPGVLVTTYTHEPNIGMLSMTDPRGYTTTYEYDDSNRLTRVKDKDGNILQDYEYNYRGN